jgi:hypothetical protein
VLELPGYLIFPTMYQHCQISTLKATQNLGYNLGCDSLQAEGTMINVALVGLLAAADKFASDSAYLIELCLDPTMAVSIVSVFPKPISSAIIPPKSSRGRSCFLRPRTTCS